MTLTDKLADPKVWEKYYNYKAASTLSKSEQAKLRSFIDNKEYLPVVERIRKGIPLNPPSKSVISKVYTSKKRIVYTYSTNENQVLKLLTYLLIRQYDSLFAGNLFSFRAGKDAQKAFKYLMHRNPGNLYAYKVDISNYFNSVNIDILSPLLKDAMKDEPELSDYLLMLLKDDRVYENGLLIREQKGIMAGVPTASFYADLYLSKMDFHFEKEGVIYARYSDDIIVFAPTQEETENHARYIKEFLREADLEINPSKENFFKPHEAWTFLGFEYKDGFVDISPASKDKLKAKLRRKTRSIERWQKRRNLTGDKAAKAFVNALNRKLYENKSDNDLTWSKWFLPVINTTKSLKEIDEYCEDCIRFLATGKRTKSRFNFTYEDIKKLGFKPLVSHYYEDWNDYSLSSSSRRSENE